VESANRGSQRWIISAGAIIVNNLGTILGTISTVRVTKVPGGLSNDIIISVTLRNNVKFIATTRRPTIDEITLPLIG
jgi:hypothetical protein